MNDDIVPLSAGWLEALLEPLANPRVDIAAPLLLYPNERVQHAGTYLSERGRGVPPAGHALRFARLPGAACMFLAAAPRQLRCVTGAVLAVRRELLERLAGFDESLASWLQDVDLCLRAHDSDREIVFTPRAILLHAEMASITQGGPMDTASRELRDKELAAFRHRWGPSLARDPFHNANFEPSDET